MKINLWMMALLALACISATWADELGYSDTPFLPGGKWRVHDSKRPHPEVVTPGPFNNQASKAPSNAIVLFDGTDLSQWHGKWKLADGYMEANNTGNITTKDKFGSCQLHLEWMEPKSKETSQGRGNSGVFLMGRYEVQVLDSYQNDTYADGQCGAVYGQTPPLVNACRPPREWQTYDIKFEAPVFKDGKLVKPAFVTVHQNGILIQDHTEILGATAHRSLPTYTPHGEKEPLSLQDHGNPIRYRNIWIRPL